MGKRMMLTRRWWAVVVVAVVVVVAAALCATPGHAAPVRLPDDAKDDDDAEKDVVGVNDAAQGAVAAEEGQEAAKPVPVSKDGKDADPKDAYFDDNYGSYEDYEELYEGDYELYADESLDGLPEDEYGLFDDDDPDLDTMRRGAAQKRRQADEEEYQRYLDEMMQEMVRDPDLREDLIEDIQLTSEDKRTQGDRDILAIALRVKNEEKVRNILEEKERQVLEAQRHAARRQEEAQLHVPRMPDEQPEGEDAEVSELFLHPEEDNDKIASVVNQRANLLGKIDSRRRMAFVQKEMKRELDFRRSVAMEKDPAKKKELIHNHKEALKELKSRHTDTPGHQKQLQDVWEKQDGMQMDFNPKVFFSLHDVNADGYWDHKELEALFYRSATKLHTIDGETDMEAVRQEMQDMRSAVMDEIDTDHDQLVSRQEFISFTAKPEFNKNGQWKALFPEFDGNELKEFAQRAKKASSNPRKQHIEPEVAEASKRFKSRLAKTMKLGTHAIKKAIQPLANLGKKASEDTDSTDEQQQQQQQQQR